MSTGRHRRDPAPGEQAPYEPAWDDTTWDQPAAREPGRRPPAADDTAWDQPAAREPAPRTPAADDTTWDQPAWREPAPRTPAADDTTWDQPAWREPGPRASAADETTWDQPAWQEQDARARGGDEQTWDDPRWHQQPPRTQARDELAGHPGGRGARRNRGALQMAVAAALVAVIGIGVTVYGLTTHVTVAGATYTPSTVGTKVPQAQPDPAALALSRSLPVKIQIPAIGVSAPIEQVGLLTDGEVQTPPLTVHNLTGWYKYGPTPGEDGASVILGHVDDYQGLSVFYYLKDLVKGDQIGVTLADGITANFIVDGLQNASKDDFPTQQVYGKIGYPGLRLITCGGSFDSATGHYDNNIIVYAHLVHSATT
jgi:sortase (surface protein transpeptidase)